MSMVVLGGTFNVFHKGHQRMLDDAITLAALKEASLTVGITSDTFAKSSRNVPVRPWEERLHDIEEYIDRDDLRPYFGPVFYLRIDSADQMPEMKDDDVLVVSEETAVDAFRILVDKGYGCAVHVVDMVKDSNGEEIHSTKILEEGR